MGKRPGDQHSVERSSTVLHVLSVLLVLKVVLLMLLGLRILSLRISSGEDSLPASGHDGISKRIMLDKGDLWMEVLSWKPRAFLYHNFLSKEECVHLINLAKPYMTLSMVIDGETGGIANSSDRTSTGTFLDLGQDRVVRGIEKRIADYTHIPVEHGDRLQILHYEEGQKYEPHTDYFEDEYSISIRSQRLATVLMYLSNVEEGGETVFPDAQGNFSKSPGREYMSKCAREGLAVKPKMGDALLFWSLKPDSSEDPLSLHGACPVIKGDKWCGTKWLHVQ